MFDVCLPMPWTCVLFGCALMSSIYLLGSTLVEELIIVLERRVAVSLCRFRSTPPFAKGHVEAVEWQEPSATHTSLTQQGLLDLIWGLRTQAVFFAREAKAVPPAFGTWEFVCRFL